MALKSGLSFRHGSCIGWRRGWIAAVAAGTFLAAAPCFADDTRDAVKSAVQTDNIQNSGPEAKDAVNSALGGDDIQRSAPLTGDEVERRLKKQPTDQERTRKSIDEAGKQGDIQHNPPAEKPVTTPPKRSGGGLDLAWLPYAILAVIGVALIYVLLRYVTHRWGNRNPASGKAVTRTVQTSAVSTAASNEPQRDRTFDEVDALAASGAFTEAVHRLLLMVQERLRSRIEHGLQVSLTSREILRRAKLPQDAATAFATLVAAVEVSLFGMRSANAATYALCRENCRRVLAAAAE
jgi:hypothetical protein